MSDAVGSMTAPSQGAGAEMPERPVLKAKLRLFDATALVISNVIGSGIFITPAIIALLAPDPGVIMALWLAGGIMAFFGAVTYGELGKILPQSGGEYVYLSRAFGPLFGFLSGWTSLIAGFSGAIAAGAVALASYLGHYFPRLTSTDPILALPLLFTTVTIGPRTIAAAAVIVLLAVIHSIGWGPGRVVQKVLALVVLGTIFVFVVTGFLFGAGSWANFSASSQGLAGSRWLLALVPIMFTYSGWNAAAYVAEEVHNPRRNLGLALALGTGVAIVVYIALNALYIFAVPVREMGASLAIGDVAAQRLFGVQSGFISPLLVVALAGAISAMTIAGPRVYFAMARDGAFFPAMGRLHAKSGMPVNAIGLQAVWSILLVAFGSFEQILLFTGFAVLLSSGAAALALLSLRRHAQEPTGVVRGIVLPLAFAASAFAVVFYCIRNAPETSLIGLAIILSGIPLFFLSRRQCRGRKHEVETNLS